MLMVERGQNPGTKTVSGGLVYSKLVAQIFPNFLEGAPVERAITGHQLVMLDDKASVALDFRDQMAGQQPYNVFSVLRARFDPWLAKQAEQAGASLVNGVTVDSLLVENGRVIGIQAGADQIGADLVVIAEGTRSLLLKQAGLREDFQPHDVSLGLKEVVALPERTIEERFQCAPGTGTAYTLVGHTCGIEGGGFLYTNKASLSVGIVVKIDSLYRNKMQPHQVLDRFKSHPLINRLLEDGEVVEYSAQTVHRGGFHLMSRLYGDGYVVVGSAARLLLNNIMTLRGMDFAILSAEAAARAILEARKGGGYSEAELSVYAANLRKTSIYEDWRTFRETYGLMENKRLFDEYPELACRIMEKLFAPGTQASPKLLSAMWQEMRGHLSMLDLTEDAYHVLRGLIL